MTPRRASPGRRSAGGGSIVGEAPAPIGSLFRQALRGGGIIEFGFDDWRPTLYAYLLWGIALGAGLVMTRASASSALFLLPRALFTRRGGDLPNCFGSISLSPTGT